MFLVAMRAVYICLSVGDAYPFTPTRRNICRIYCIFLYQVDQNQHICSNPEEVANSLSKLEKLRKPPRIFLTWLEKSKRLRPTTLALYEHAASQFLSVMEIIVPDKTPSLSMCWNISLCQAFFDVMEYLLCESTLVNLHSALMAMRTYLKRIGRSPPNVENLLADFRDMFKGAIKEKKMYVSRRKEQVLSDKTLVWLFYHRVYDNNQFLHRFYKIADQIKLAQKENLPVERLSASDLFFCNAFIMSIMTASNYHRLGNLCLIEYKQAKDEISRARKALQKKHPGMNLLSKDQAIDRSHCEPAILTVKKSTKKGSFLRFVLPSPRDVDLVSLYIKIRPFGPHAPKTTKLFVNARGRSVGPKVTHFLQKLGESVKIMGLNCQVLRSLMETENVLDTEPGASGVSQHLGHLPSTRDEYYVQEDERHHIQAAFRLWSKLLDIGKKKDHPVSQKKLEFAIS